MEQKSCSLECFILFVCDVFSERLQKSLVRISLPSLPLPSNEHHNISYDPPRDKLLDRNKYILNWKGVNQPSCERNSVINRYQFTNPARRKPRLTSIVLSSFHAYQAFFLSELTTFIHHGYLKQLFSPKQ